MIVQLHTEPEETVHAEATACGGELVRSALHKLAQMKSMICLGTVLLIITRTGAMEDQPALRPKPDAEIPINNNKSDKYLTKCAGYSPNGKIFALRRQVSRSQDVIKLYSLSPRENKFFFWKRHVSISLFWQISRLYSRQTVRQYFL